MKLSQENFQSVIQNDSLNRFTSTILTPFFSLLMAELKQNSLRTLSEISSKRLGEILESLGMIRQNIDFGKLSNREVRLLVELVDNRLDVAITQQTVNFSREELLTNLVRFGGLLSILTLQVYSGTERDVQEKILDWNDWGKIPLDQQTTQLINRVGDMLRLGNEQSVFDSRFFMGELKSSIELGINAILLGEIKTRRRNSDKSLNLVKLLSLLNARLILRNVQDCIFLIRSDRRYVKIDIDRGFILPEKTITSFQSYSELIKDTPIQLDTPKTAEMLEFFKKITEYSPGDFSNYLTSENKAFQMNNLVTLVEKPLIEADLILGKWMSPKGANNVVADLTLNNKAFQLGDHHNNKMSLQTDRKDIKAINYVGHPNHRFFRSPIIDAGEYYITSPWTLFEVLQKLKLRILSRDVLPRSASKINEIGKKDFDEGKLSVIKQALQDIGFEPKINFDMSQNSLLKELMDSKRDLPHELDLVYCQSEVLIIWDLKNYKIQYSYSDITKMFDKITTEKNKLRKLRQLIFDNQTVFTKALGSSFKDVRLGILTVDPTAYSYFKHGGNDDVSLMSVEEFITNIQQH